MIILRVSGCEVGLCFDLPRNCVSLSLITGRTTAVLELTKEHTEALHTELGYYLSFMNNQSNKGEVE